LQETSTNNTRNSYGSFLRFVDLSIV